VVTISSPFWKSIEFITAFAAVVAFLTKTMSLAGALTKLLNISMDSAISGLIMRVKNRVVSDSIFLTSSN
jgi:hypothetical protein